MRSALHTRQSSAGCTEGAFLVFPDLRTQTAYSTVRSCKGADLQLRLSLHGSLPVLHHGCTVPDTDLGLERPVLLQRKPVLWEEIGTICFVACFSCPAKPLSRFFGAAGGNFSLRGLPCPPGAEHSVEGKPLASLDFKSLQLMTQSKDSPGPYLPSASSPRQSLCSTTGKCAAGSPSLGRRLPGAQPEGARQDEK